MATPLLDDVQPADETSQAPSNAQRVATGFGQSFTGPLNIARGLTGIGLSIASHVLHTFFNLTRKTIALALAKKVVHTVRSSDPAAPADDAAPSLPVKGGGVRKPLLITLVVALVLAVGGTAFKLLRTPKAPPVAPEPPRVRPASGATGDSAPAASDEETAAVVADEDPRKIGE